MQRRTLLTLLTLGLAETLTACSRAAAPTVIPPSPAPPLPLHRGSRSRSVVSHRKPPRPTVTASPTGPYPPAHPGPPTTVAAGPPGSAAQIALTIDDGYDAETVAAYVDFAATTGTHLTFSPNGVYAGVWDQHARVLRPLIEAGQVQIGNHTFGHLDLQTLSGGRIEAELETNETWIQNTFGITSRPWFRPPYGYHDQRVDGVAGQAGFTNVLMWNGSLGDSRLLTPQLLLAQADRYVRGGTILLGHANHPTVTHLYGALLELIRDRGLTAVTLDEMFGTSRAQG